MCGSICTCSQPGDPRWDKLMKALWHYLVPMTTEPSDLLTCQRMPTPLHRYSQTDPSSLLSDIYIYVV